MRVLVIRWKRRTGVAYLRQSLKLARVARTDECAQAPLDGVLCQDAFGDTSTQGQVQKQVVKSQLSLPSEIETCASDQHYNRGCHAGVVRHHYSSGFGGRRQRVNGPFVVLFGRHGEGVKVSIDIARDVVVMDNERIGEVTNCV